MPIIEKFREYYHHVTNMVIVYGDIPDKFFFLKYGDLRYANFSDIRNYGNVTYDTIFFNFILSVL